MQVGFCGDMARYSTGVWELASQEGQYASFLDFFRVVKDAEENSKDPPGMPALD